MVKRLLAPLVAIAATVFLAAPASAAGATSSTQNMHGPFAPFHVDSMCGAPGGTISGTGNAVFHITVNAAGDVWITSTQEAFFTLTPDVGTVTFTGHFAVWFGLSANNQNSVLHDIVNVNATGSDGSTITLNVVDHLSISASGQVNLFMDCH